MNNNDTICALATAQGGAIGGIRISGEDAINNVAKCFEAASGKKLEEVKLPLLLNALSLGTLKTKRETL